MSSELLTSGLVRSSTTPNSEGWPTDWTVGCPGGCGGGGGGGGGRSRLEATDSATTADYSGVPATDVSEC